jgi:5'-deoxynucleotidase YfbR-like HD superfamily hydrolase
MKKITDIYTEYKIMPNLQLHQLKVASVAEQICLSLNVPVDTQRIIAACLVHDMANIVKFNLLHFPEFLEPEGLEYWQTVKREYIEKYGEDDHEATRALIRELNLEPDVLKLAEEVLDYTKGDNIDSFSLDACICKYADTRLTPHGVMSLRARLEEWQKRDARITLEYMENTYSTFHSIEKKIFTYSNITPDGVTDESIAESVEKLKNFQI